MTSSTERPKRVEEKCDVQFRILDYVDRVTAGSVAALLRVRKCRIERSIRKYLERTLRLPVGRVRGYRKALMRQVEAAERYQCLGRKSEKEKDWAAAATAYEVGIQAARNVAPASLFFRLGRVRTRQKRWREAIEAYRSAVVRDGTQPEWFFQLGRVYEKTGAWTEASEAYTAATKVAVGAQARWFYRLGRVLEKVQVESPVYHRHLGLCIAAHGDWIRAERAYSSAVALNPREPKYQVRLGYVRMRMREFEGAARALEAALIRRPRQASLLYQLGRAREGCLNFQGALNAYQAAIEVQPEHRGAQARINAINVKLGRWEDSTTGQVLLSKVPPLPKRLRGLLTQIRLTDTAICELLEEAKNKNIALPEDWWFDLHWRCLATGRFSLAYQVKDMTAALVAGERGELNSIGFTRYLEVAKALVQLGRSDEAVEHLRPILEGSAGTDSERVSALVFVANLKAMHGDFGAATEALSICSGVNMREAETLFRDLVSGRSVAVVGPIVNHFPNGTEIDSFDVVIRTNFLSGALGVHQARTLGTRTDISYFNGVASKKLASKIREAIETTDLQLAVMRPFTYRDDIRWLARPGDLRYNPGESNVLLRARHFAIPRIVHDVLRYQPSRVKVFNIDFFVSHRAYKRGYRASMLLGERDPFFLGFSHDFRGDFIFMKQLLEKGLIGGDSLVENLLGREADEYLAMLDFGSEVSTVSFEGDRLQRVGV